jgi:hypothetical protein
MTTNVMLGSVSYSTDSKKVEFENSLKSLDQAITELGYNCRRIDARWQNLELNYSGYSLLKILYWHSRFQTEIYSEKNKSLFFLKDLILNSLRAVRDTITMPRKEFLIKHVRNHFRIRFITDKQLRIIGSFLDSNSDYLLVCEDDIILNSDPKVFLKDAIQLAEKHNNSLFITICNNSAYSKVSNHFGGSIKDYSESSRWKEIDFFVNGCAMYLLNRPMAALINEFVVKNPMYRLCSIDWLLSLIGRNAGEGEVVTCLIPSENFIGNGSRE